MDAKCKHRAVIHLQITLMFLLFTTAGLACAQGPVDHVEIQIREDVTEIQIVFNDPINYLYHTPHNVGNILLIGVRPIMLGNTDAQIMDIRQIISFDRDKAPGVISLEFISEDGFPPYILIEFENRQHYQVRLANDFRRLVVTLLPEK